MSKRYKWLHKVSTGLLSLLIVVVTGGRARAQSDSVWVEARGRCYSTEVTPEEGWKRALHDAEANAIRSSLGVSITSQTFGVTSESVNSRNQSDYLSTFSELNTTTTCGKVTSEEILDKKLSSENQIPVYQITIRALVVKDRGVPDPNFRAEIHLDKDTYYDRGAIDRNDAVKFSVSVNQDCYLYLFDIMANDSVMILLPNDYLKDNFYPAAEGPGAFDKKIARLPINLTVGLPPGKETTTEMFYLVALKKKVDFYSQTMTHESVGIIPTYQSAILDFQKWLVLIPQDLRTTASATFIIKRLR